MSSQNAIAHVFDYLDTRIKSGAWKTGERIPTIAQLATELKVAKNTVSSAIQLLSEQKKVFVRRKAGIFVGEPGFNNDLKSKPPQLKARKLSQKIARDLVENVFGFDEFLPGYKELAYRYGCGYQTLKTALSILEEQHRISAVKKKYRIVRYTSPGYSKEITIFHSEQFFSMLEQSYFRSWFYLFLHHLEKECAHRRIRLVRKTLTPDFVADKSSSALGSIVWLDRFLVPQINTLRHSIGALENPIALFDDEDLCETPPKGKNIWLFRPSNFSAGFQIGKYLLDTGHKKVAFFANNAQHWTRRRYEGIIAAFHSVGYDATSIIPFFLSDHHETVPEHERVTATSIAWKNLVQSAGLSKLYVNMHISAQSKAQIAEKINTMTYGMWLEKMYAPLIESALKQSDISAFVAADDYIGTQGILPNLSKHRIRVPHDISVVGFNNMVETFYENFSSYDFNMPAIVGTMLDTLLWPEKKESRQGLGQIVETEGFISIRGSSAQFV